MFSVPNKIIDSTFILVRGGKQHYNIIVTFALDRIIIPVVIRFNFKLMVSLERFIKISI